VTGVEKHGTGATWFWKNSIWIAPVTGFGIAIAVAYGVIEWL
jgi:uncharacterized protein involved in exopolysaccharide biosynthesis